MKRFFGFILIALLFIVTASMNSPPRVEPITANPFPDMGPVSIDEMVVEFADFNVTIDVAPVIVLYHPETTIEVNYIYLPKVVNPVANIDNWYVILALNSQYNLFDQDNEIYADKWISPLMMNQSYTATNYRQGLSWTEPGELLIAASHI